MQESLNTDRRHSQDVWVLRSDTTECALTHNGGHMAPVTFFADTARPLKPYYVSPWQDEDLELDEPVLGSLRGDFFCLPFGANPAWKGENHRVHGEVAYRRWKKAAFTDQNGVKTLTLTLRPNDINTEGIPTCHALSKRKSTLINYIQGAARIPRGFDRVKRVRFATARIEFIAHSGKSVTVPVCHGFINTGSLVDS